MPDGGVFWFGLDNLDLEDNSVRLLGKRNKKRIIPLTSKTRVAQEEYLQVCAGFSRKSAMMPDAADQKRQRENGANHST